MTREAPQPIQLLSPGLPTVSHVASVPREAPAQSDCNTPDWSGLDWELDSDRQSPSITTIPDSRRTGRQQKILVDIVDRPFWGCDGEIGPGVLTLLEIIGNPSVNRLENVCGKRPANPGVCN